MAICNEEEITSKDLFYAAARFIYTIGLFVIFIKVKDLKVRAICNLTMLLPGFIEFIFSKFSSKFDF